MKIKSYPFLLHSRSLSTIGSVGIEKVEIMSRISTTIAFSNIKLVNTIYMKSYIKARNLNYFLNLRENRSQNKEESKYKDKKSNPRQYLKRIKRPSASMCFYFLRFIVFHVIRLVT